MLKIQLTFAFINEAIRANLLRTKKETKQQRRITTEGQDTQSWNSRYFGKCVFCSESVALVEL